MESRFEASEIDTEIRYAIGYSPELFRLICKKIIKTDVPHFVFTLRQLSKFHKDLIDRYITPMDITINIFSMNMRQNMTDIDYFIKMWSRNPIVKIKAKHMDLFDNDGFRRGKYFMRYLGSPEKHKRYGKCGFDGYDSYYYDSYYNISYERLEKIDFFEKKFHIIDITKFEGCYLLDNRIDFLVRMNPQCLYIDISYNKISFTEKREEWFKKCTAEYVNLAESTVSLNLVNCLSRCKVICLKGTKIYSDNYFSYSFPEEKIMELKKSGVDVITDRTTISNGF